MQSHPHFNLRLHTDEELAVLAGGEIVQRTALHEWPLSCVQFFRLIDGRQMIYKAAWGPTVEAEFYARARASLLVSARAVYQQDGYSCLLIDWIDAPRLGEASMSQADLLQTWDDLSTQLIRLPGDLPCYLDLRCASGWQTVVEQITGSLDELKRAGELHAVTSASVQAIRRACNQSEVLEVLRKGQGLVHADLSGDNVFIVESGYRVIDWQRPVYGPQALDLVTLLESSGYDAIAVVEPGILRLHRLLSIHWLAQCAVRWFPDGIQTYDRQIAELVETMEAGG
jgi:hypothetical protein